MAIIQQNEYLTFDDVLILPAYSNVKPDQTDTSVNICKNIKLHIPIISSAMDTVTEHAMARKMAELGGIGIIHKNMTIEEQVENIKIVKKSESTIINDPLLIHHSRLISEAEDMMHKNNISGIPVIDDNNCLVGIITNRDIRFMDNKHKKVSDLMSKNPVTISEDDVSIKNIQEYLYKNKIEKLPVINDQRHCIGMVTFKDISNIEKNPYSTRNAQGKLIVGVASDTTIERADELIAAGADMISIDTAHGHSEHVIDITRKIRAKYNDVVISSGNIVTCEAAKALIDAGADIIKIGIGPGSICTTRVVAGIGCPQWSAVYEISKYIHENIQKSHVTCIADGGIRNSGDIVKAIGAGATCVMLGSLLAGTDEAPGNVIDNGDGYYKVYRGMGSKGAMDTTRYLYNEKTKFTAEGVEGYVHYKGKLSSTISNLIGGLRAGMGYTGSATISDLHKNAKFIKVTNAALKEAYPHDITMLKNNEPL